MLSFNIEDILSWSSLYNDEKYELAILTKMQARRVTEIGKVVIDHALKLTQNNPVNFVVHASRHGEVGLSNDLINSIINNEIPSPMKFSASTHNAVVGQYSIISKDTSPITAISAGKNSFIMGLVSAVNYLNTHKDEKVLYLFSDGKVPEIFKDKLTEPNENIVISMVISSGDNYNLEVTKTHDTSHKLQSSEFLEFIKVNGKTKNFGHIQLTRKQ